MIKKISICARLSLITSLALVALSAYPASAHDKKNNTNANKSALSLPIMFFQKSISKADGDRCPMYPSCSHYASQAIKRHGAIKGWILSCDRLLRCGRDEVRLSPKVRAKETKRTFDPLEANTSWWSNP